MSSTQYDDAILDSNAIDPTDKNGNPIPVTIPIMLAPGIKVVYTTRLGGTSEGDFAHFNLGGKSGDKPEHVLANRKALADVLGAKISLISQVHSGDAVDVDESFVINQPFGFDVSGTKKPEDETDDENNATGNGGEPTVIEADGQVTSQKNVALGMFAADCLPVLMAQRTAAVVVCRKACSARPSRRWCPRAPSRNVSSPRSAPASAATATRSVATSPTNSMRSSREPSR